MENKNIILSLSQEEVMSILNGLQHKMKAEQKSINRYESDGNFPLSLRYLDAYKRTSDLFNKVCDQSIVFQELVTNA